MRLRKEKVKNKDKRFLAPGIFRLSIIVALYFLVNIFIFKLFGYENDETYQTINTIFVVFTFYLTLDLFYKNTNLAKSLSSPAIELVKIEHVLKEDGSGIESFALLRNNTSNSIRITSFIDQEMNNYSRLNSAGIKKETVTTVLSQDIQSIVSAGGVESVKILDSSFEFIESQQFYSLNKNIEEQAISKAPKDYGNFTIFFTYDFLEETKYLKVSVNYHDYRSFLKEYRERISDTESELKSVYIFLKEDLGLLLAKNIYFKMTASKIEAFLIRDIDEPWLDSEKISHLPKDDRYTVLYEIQDFFFRDADSFLLKKINAIVLDYGSFTYYRSYNTSSDLSLFYGYEYIDNAFNRANHSIINKLRAVEKEFSDVEDFNHLEKIVNSLNSQMFISGQARLSELTRVLDVKQIRWRSSGNASSRIKVWDENLLEYRYVEAYRNYLVIA